MGKILVTRGLGFIGSHIAKYYAKKGDEIIVFDNLSRLEFLGRVFKCCSSRRTVSSRHQNFSVYISSFN